MIERFFLELSPENWQRLNKINELLDEQMRPYLQGDGGDLYALGLEGNTLTVHYQSARGSCPSSVSDTLVGIQNLVKSIEPDNEVVASKKRCCRGSHPSTSSFSIRKRE